MNIKQFTEVASVIPLLEAGGLNKQAAAKKADLLQKSAELLLQAGVEEHVPAQAYFVPGRVEVLGKHTDYAGGRSVVSALDRGFVYLAAGRDDNQVKVYNVMGRDSATFSLNGDIAPPVGHWSNYPMTVARRVSRNFPGPLKGAEVAFASDLPPASGMSSSSAMMVGFFQVLSGINHLEQTAIYQDNITSRESLAEYLGTVENGQSFGSLTGDKGVGTFGGSEDHTAILCGKANQFSQYSYCPVKFERALPVYDDLIMVIGGSGVVAEKTGAAMEKYNRASRLARRVAEIWREKTSRADPHLAAIIGSSAGAVDELRVILQGLDQEQFDKTELLHRFEQFYAESVEIIPSAGDALLARDYDEFGRQVDRSQELAEKLLCNQVQETVFLAQSARRLGAIAASGFGAGFGGSVWAMTRVAQAEDFLQQWKEEYSRKYPQLMDESRFFLTRPGPAAFEIGKT